MKHLPSNHRDLRTDLQNPSEKPGTAVQVYNPCLRDRRIPVPCWPANLAQSVRFRFSGRPVSNNKIKRAIKEDNRCQHLASTCRYAMSRGTYTHTYKDTLPQRKVKSTSVSLFKVGVHCEEKNKTQKADLMVWNIHCRCVYRWKLWWHPTESNYSQDQHGPREIQC